MCPKDTVEHATRGYLSSKVKKIRGVVVSMMSLTFDFLAVFSILTTLWHWSQQVMSFTQGIDGKAKHRTKSEESHQSVRKESSKSLDFSDRHLQYLHMNNESVYITSGGKCFHLYQSCPTIAPYGRKPRVLCMVCAEKFAASGR